MPFLTDLKNKQDGTKRKGYTPTAAQKAIADALPTQKEMIMAEILTRSGFSGASASVQYANLNSILAARDAVSADIAAAGLKEDDSVIGGVSELICRIGLEAAAPGRYDKLPKGWDWIGDYAITGLPFNLYISVKSYYAKERLIFSGTGQGAAPVIGYGLFKDESEWSPVRVHQYRHRGFVAIYMPSALYSALSAKTGRGYPATDIMNIYERPLLRDIKDFADDIRNVVSPANLIIDLKKL
ncbi:MAG: hypothetical protein Q4A15_06130 [Prevotellaceae bacterium]|nr:hypothetical protein [Prevotellaceae bacterium]